MQSLIVLLVNPSHMNTKMLRRQHIVWKFAEGWLTSLSSHLSWSNATVQATYAMVHLHT